MGSTTIHFPEKLLNKIDVAATDHGISRNKYVLHACEEALKKEEGEWTEDFFKPHLSAADYRLLNEAVEEMERERNYVVSCTVQSGKLCFSPSSMCRDRIRNSAIRRVL